MMKKLMVSIIILCGICSWSCADKSVNPLQKSAREYTWTIDTIANPGSYQTSMYAIWGSSATDVYVVGDDSDGKSNAFHFDGKSWTATHTGFTATVMTAIHGFSSRDIWIVGARYWGRNDSGLVIHYDGTSWRNFRIGGARFLGTIWGMSPDDIWAGGWAGTLIHFDGAVWSSEPADTECRYYSISGLGRKEVYALGVRNSDPDNLVTGYYLLKKYDGTHWTTADSMSAISSAFRFGPYGLGTYAGRLYSLGYGLLSYNDGQWHHEVSTSSPTQAFYASSEQNMFIVGQNSQIYHFNGKDWKELQGIVSGNWWFEGVWCTEAEAFVVGHDASGQKSIVAHGK